MTWRPSKSPRECSGINRRNTVSCFVIHKYGNGKQRLLVAADPCASSQITQSQRVHTKERRTRNALAQPNAMLLSLAMPTTRPRLPSKVMNGMKAPYQPTEVIYATQ